MKWFRLAMLERLREMFWPLGAAAEDSDKETEIVAIRSATWKESIDEVLAEARRLRDIETNRSNSTSTNAQFYIGGLLAFIPISFAFFDFDYVGVRLTSIETIEFIAFLLLLVAVTYAVGAFYCSMRVLKVRAHHRFGISDFIKLDQSDAIKLDLAKEILCSVRNDRVSVNEKVSHIDAAQQHISRMAIAFGASTLLFILGEPITQNLTDWGSAAVTYVCGT